MLHDGVTPQRRLGKFSINMKLIDSAPEIIRELMGHMIVLRAEIRYDRDYIDYVAESELFAPVDRYMIAPDYELRRQDGVWHAERISF